ncbi:MAG TPA: hypothetical protein DGF10_09975, partial [Acidimicrobiaceae bacterium]|nr:hypothetical protein [Acidimicrobiaceae bacterium]
MGCRTDPIQAGSVNSDGHPAVVKVSVVESDWLPAAFRAPPKTHKRPTFPLVTMVGREGFE